MQASDAPAKLQQPFANSGARNAIPQAQVNPGQASFDLGFPPETMEPEIAGGVPPDGKDFNGILYDTTAIDVWTGAGGSYPFDGAFAGEVGGYPIGALLLATDSGGQWLSGNDNNSVDPESTGGPAVWTPHRSGGVSSYTLGNVNLALTPLNGAPRVQRFSGTLTGNVQVTLPAWPGYAWVLDYSAVVFGAYSITFKTSAGGFIVGAPGICQAYVAAGSPGALVRAFSAAAAGSPGVVALSTLALVLAKTDNTTAITPLLLSQAYPFGSNANGNWVTRPDGRLFQDGLSAALPTGANTAQVVVTFPTPYVGVNPPNIVASPNNAPTPGKVGMGWTVQVFGTPGNWFEAVISAATLDISINITNTVQMMWSGPG